MATPTHPPKWPHLWKHRPSWKVATITGVFLALALAGSLSAGETTSDKDREMIQRAINLSKYNSRNFIEEILPTDSNGEVLVVAKEKKDDPKPYRSFHRLTRSANGWQVTESCAINDGITPQSYLVIRQALRSSKEVKFKRMLSIMKTSKNGTAEAPGEVHYLVQTGSADAGFLSGSGEMVFLKQDTDGKLAVESVKPCRY